MSHILKRILVGASLLSLFALARTAVAAEKSEDQLIADLDSPRAQIVNEALLKLEKQYPTSTKAFPKMKKLLTDNRPEVRRKSARVLGVLHADVSSEDLKNIVAMFKGDAQEQMDALKSLRGLKAQQTVPDILPLLKSTTPNVVRDACRTLAVLGSKDTIPALEPLLNNPNSAIKKDAQDAIFALRNK
jgi:HEAT repeat protein